MKRNISKILLFCILICGCGSKTNTVDLTETQSKETQEVFTTEAEIKTEESLFDKDVDIIFSMYSFDESIGIEDYIAGLQQENPNAVYRVYDESHYVQVIKESERKEILEELKSEEYISDAFKEIFSDEQYNGAFLTMEYDELFQNITFYADKTAYDNAGIAVVFGPVVISAMFSDIMQAYNLIPLEERETNILILDNDTNEVIYDTKEEIE